MIHKRRTFSARRQLSYKETANLRSDKPERECFLPQVMLFINVPLLRAVNIVKRIAISLF